MRRLTRDLCDFMCQLADGGSVSSLNVSVAAGVCLFEAVGSGAQKALTALNQCQIATLQSGKAFVDSAPQNLVGPENRPILLATPRDGWL